MNNKIIDVAFTLAEKNFKTKQFSLSEIWKLTSKETKHDANSETFVDFYLEILQDPRFVSTGNDKWVLRNSLTTKEFDKLYTSKYSNIEYEEEYDKNEIIDEVIDEDSEYSAIVTDFETDDIVDEHKENTKLNDLDDSTFIDENQDENI